MLGHSIFVIAPQSSLSNYSKEKKLKSDYYFRNVYIKRLALIQFGIKQLYLFKGIVRSLRKISPDIIMVHGMQMLPVIQIVKYSKRASNCMLYADFHADFQNSGKSNLSKYFLHKVVWRLIIRYYEKYFQKIYYTRPSVKQFSIEMYKLKPKRLYSLFMGAYLFDNRKNPYQKINLIKYLGIPLDSFIIVTGGKIDSINKLESIINSIKILKRNNVHLIIFGTISSRYKDILGSDLKIKQVHYLGWQPPEEINNIFMSSNIAIFLGLHSVLWEQAVGCGCPLMIKYEKNRRYLNLGGNVVFLNSLDEREISTKLEMITDERIQNSIINKKAINKGIKVFSQGNRITKLTIDWENQLYE